MPVEEARDNLVRWSRHLFPILLPGLLVVISWCVHGLAGDNNPRPNYAADIAFAAISFWIWAVTTNTHNGFLVTGSGMRKGSDTERRNEVPFLLTCGLLTCVLYLLSHLLAPPVAFPLSVVSIGIPVIALGSP